MPFAFAALDARLDWNYKKSEPMVSDISKSPLLALTHEQKAPQRASYTARAMSHQAMFFS
jgi:hypothetical protein